MRKVWTRTDYLPQIWIFKTNWSLFTVLQANEKQKAHSNELAAYWAKKSRKTAFLSIGIFVSLLILVPSLVVLISYVISVSDLWSTYSINLDSRIIFFADFSSPDLALVAMKQLLAHFLLWCKRMWRTSWQPETMAKELLTYLFCWHFIRLTPSSAGCEPPIMSQTLLIHVNDWIS